MLLGNTAGKDPRFDSELSGRVKATLALVNMNYEDVYGESPDDDKI